MNAPFNEHIQETFYIRDPVVGYTDYPFLNQENNDNEYQMTKVCS